MSTEYRLFASVGGVVLFLLAGRGALEFFPDLVAKKLLLQMAYSYLIGIVGVSAALWGMSHFVGVPIRGSVVLAIAASMVFAGIAFCLFRRKRGLDRQQARVGRQNRSARYLVIAASVLGALLSLSLFADALANPLKGFDGMMTWTAAARYVRAERTVDARVLRQEQWYITHPRYPLLMPLAQVAVQEVFHATDDTRVVCPIYAIFFPACLLILFDRASIVAGRSHAALAVLIFLSIPLFSFTLDSGAGTAYSDFPLACFYGAGLLLWLHRVPSSSSGLLSGLLVGGGVLTKNEGTPLAIIALTIAAVIAGRAIFRRWKIERSRSLRLLIPLFLMGLMISCALGLLVSWRSGIVERYDENYDSRLSVQAVVSGAVHRLPEIIVPMLHEMNDPAVWAGFWWIFLLVLLVGWKAMFRRPGRHVLVAILGGIAAYFIAYFITPWPDTAALVRASWNRLLEQQSLLIFTLFSMALQQVSSLVNRRNCPPARPIALHFP